MPPQPGNHKVTPARHDRTCVSYRYTWTDPYAIGFESDHVPRPFTGYIQGCILVDQNVTRAISDERILQNLLQLTAESSCTHSICRKNIQGPVSIGYGVRGIVVPTSEMPHAHIRNGKRMLLRESVVARSCGCTRRQDYNCGDGRRRVHRSRSKLQPTRYGKTMHRRGTGCVGGCSGKGCEFGTVWKCGSNGLRSNDIEDVFVHIHQRSPQANFLEEVLASNLHQCFVNGSTYCVDTMV